MTKQILNTALALKKKAKRSNSIKQRIVAFSIKAKEVAAMFVINLITVRAAVLIYGIPIYLMKPKKILSEEN